MHTKRLNTLFNKWVQFRLVSIPRLRDEYITYPGYTMTGDLVSFFLQPVTTPLQLFCWPALDKHTGN